MVRTSGAAEIQGAEKQRLHSCAIRSFVVRCAPGPTVVQLDLGSRQRILHPAITDTAREGGRGQLTLGSAKLYSDSFAAG